jgi:Flp pilus assembly protein TadD
MLVPCASAAQATPTFARDIAPIVYEACGVCHRDDGPGPFSLLTYEQVRRRATQIAVVTRRGFMPPWKAEPEAGHFVGQRRLTDREIESIGAWVNAGAPEGDPRDLPAPPSWPKGWLLGTPDLIVRLPEPFMLPAASTDVFRIFAVKIPNEVRRYVRGIEFHPGNPGVVHHANMRIDRTATTRDLDAADPLPGYDGLMPRSAEYPEGHFLGWTPGQVAPLVGPDLAWPLEPGSDLVLQLHLQPSGAVEPVQPSVAFYFGDRPPARTPTILRLGSQGIDIKPGERAHVIRDSYRLPVDVDVLAVQPHAHYRAREIRGMATLPDGRQKTMMLIRDWDFRWQHVYREQVPIPLPRGTVLSMEYTYDNSADNPRNPQVPPERVRWGQRSRDEMGDLWFQVSTRSERDRLTLVQEVQRKMTAEDVIGLETMLLVTPDDHELHDDAAVLYLGLGRADDAVRHFAASARLRPSSAPAHYNLATALSVAGRLDEAVAEYRRALAIEPQYARALANLGSVLLQQGRSAEGVDLLERAVRLDPANVEALNTLSTGYVSLGDVDRALATINRAIALAPPGPVADMLRERRGQLQKK